MLRRTGRQLKQAGKLRAILLAAALTLTSSVGAMPRSQAAQESPYRVSEFPVRVTQGLQSDAVVSGKWVLWRDGPGEIKRIFGKNLETDLEFIITTGEALQWPVDVDGDVIVAAEGSQSSQKGVFGYRLPDGSRFTIAPLKGDAQFYVGVPRISGKVVVWAEGPANAWDIYGYDLNTQRAFALSTNPGHQESPAVAGNYVVWLDKRHAPSSVFDGDIFGYDLSAGQEFRITPRTEIVGPPAISGNVVVWSAQREGVSYLLGYDIAKKQEFAIGQTPQNSLIKRLDMDGNVLVFAARGELDEDIFAYDLNQKKPFTVSRAIGNQSEPRIASSSNGRTVVWTDARREGIGKYDQERDIYGARLEPGPAPLPPVAGAPVAADAKIEIVWPHGGAPVAEADKANIGVWLFLADTLKLAPCQWSPKVRLWKATNNEPAKPVEADLRKVAHYYNAPMAIPSFDFNDVDVSTARDPNNRVFFFATIEGVPSRTNVLAHAADARTYFPQQDVPAGVAPIGGAVEARIEIVWPHDDAPVEQARKVNIGAALFSPGTLQSVPPDWNPTVRLYRSLNNEVAREVAVGQKRPAQGNGFTYPVWYFNDVDVSAANAPANKYYFTLSVDGVATHTNVWAHGADARTYFPQVDPPSQDCRFG